MSFDAVNGRRARRADVVVRHRRPFADTAAFDGRAEEDRRVIGRNHGWREVLLVVDGNTGQNASPPRSKAFDGRWADGSRRDQAGRHGQRCAGRDRAERPIPVYFIGVGEKLEDLTFSAREFARALLE